MTEKNYGGSTGVPQPKTNFKQKKQAPQLRNENKKSDEEFDNEETFNLEKLKKAGKIVREAKIFARALIKKDMPLLEIAEKIEAKIEELGGKPAFPVNLSINEVAAHYTPSYNDETKAHGLLKVDIGAHVDGFVADSAFSMDLENSSENKKLIEAAEKALHNAVEIVKLGTHLREIGAAVEKTIRGQNFQPIINLCGHSIAQFQAHAGITIPNYDNHQEIELEEGVFAIEPFATTGLGKVADAKPSGIYSVESNGQVRDNFAREILDYIAEEYQTLPFCSRWLVKKFGTRALIAIKRIEDAGILHHHFQLVEVSKKPVAQAEHTIILTGKEKIIST